MTGYLSGFVPFNQQEREGNYFNGLPLTNQATNGLDKDWGDVSETALASVLKYISTGSFRVAGQKFPLPDPKLASLTGSLISNSKA